MEAFLKLKTIHLRITTNYEMDTITEFLNPFAITYLVSQEDPGIHQHYHILLQYQDDDSRHNKLRYKIKDQLKLTGNGSYSISTVKSPKQLMKYIVKDNGLIKNKGVPDEVIELMKLCSTKKGKKSFNEELAILEQSYFEAKHMFFDKFAQDVVSLKIKYGHNLYSNQIKAYLLRIKMKKNPMEIQNYIISLKI